jgi:aquaporin Z
MSPEAWSGTGRAALALALAAGLHYAVARAGRRVPLWWASYREADRSIQRPVANRSPLRTSLKAHWPEYAIEAAGIAAFMTSALCFTALLEHPTSPVHALLPNPALRRALMGLAMGATAVALVYSPWGQRSGAHFNPALTLTFFRLGKVEGPDAFFYVAAQFSGAVLGVFVTSGWLAAAAHPNVHHAVTLPGPLGVPAAFVAELAISFGLMLTVLCASNAPRTARFTGLFAGLLVATYITLEAPISGMSMNPARTFGSAAGAGEFSALWLYFTAPPLGMLLAGEFYVRALADQPVRCAKLHHQNRQRCIFRCGYAASCEATTEGSETREGETSWIATT